MKITKRKIISGNVRAAVMPWGLWGLYIVVFLSLLPLNAQAGEKSYAAANIKSLNVGMLSGDIAVTGWDENKIVIICDNFEELKIEEKSGELRIVSGFEEKQGFDDDDPDIKIRLPKTVMAGLRSISGDIRVEGLGKRVKAKTVSGNIVARDVHAATTLNTVSGDLKASGIRGDVIMKSVSGDIQGRDLEGTLVEGKSVSGHVTFTNVVGRSIRVSTQSGDVVVTGSIKASDGSVELKSFSGDVDFRLPEDAAFDIEASCRSGQVLVKRKLKLSLKEDAHIRGRSGGGGINVSLNTFSGDIVIR